MAALPAEYRWLNDERAPRMLVEAVKLFGTVEVPGKRSSPIILGWAAELNLQKTYSGDDIPWCGLFMAAVAHRAGKSIPDAPLWALSWTGFGRPVSAPMLGDVMVKSRAGGGHVTMYVGEDAEAYHCLGGNQSDAVCIRSFPKSIPWQFRRPIYAVQPANVRVVYLAATGELSTKEA